jgi:hypothetical protein
MLDLKYVQVCRVTGTNLYSILMLFHVLILKKTCFGGFSLDSYSANDQ